MFLLNYYFLSIIPTITSKTTLGVLFVSLLVSGILPIAQWLHPKLPFFLFFSLFWVLGLEEKGLGWLI